MTILTGLTLLGCVLACFFDCEKKWSVRCPHLRDACRPSTLLRRADSFFSAQRNRSSPNGCATASCCPASCPFLPWPWASCVSYVAVFDATFCWWPSCPGPSCPDPSYPGPSYPGPSCHPSFYPAAPQCRSATNRWQGQVQCPYKPTRRSQRWPHVVFFSAFLVSPWVCDSCTAKPSPQGSESSAVICSPTYLNTRSVLIYSRTQITRLMVYRRFRIGFRKGRSARRPHLRDAC